MTMRVQINHVDQFYELVQPADSRLKADSGEPPELEIVLMPGDYKGTNLTLGSSLDDRLVQVVMRGMEPADPARLSDLSLHLKGITLRLENLVFLDTTSDAALLNVHATEEIIISNCAFICNSSVSKPGGKLVEMSAGSSATRAKIQNCWFIRNQTGNQDPLLAFDSLLPRCFAHVGIENVAFLDNDAAFTIAPYATQTLNITNCVHCPSAEQPPPVFVAINSTDTALTTHGSIIAGESVEQIVTRWSATTTSVDEFKPLHFQQSTLLVNDPPTVDAVPKNTILDETIIQPVTMLKPTKAISKFTDKCIRLAKTGHAPDFKQLKMALVSSR